MMKPKKNPVTKLIGAGVKGIITGKPKAIINGKSFTKGGKKVLATPGGKVGRAIENKARAAINMPKGITTGKAKAANKITKISAERASRGQIDRAALGNRMAKGSNKKTAKAKKELGNFDTAIQKHPLIRNAGQPSAEGKYRANRGRPVPVKKKAK